MTELHERAASPAGAGASPERIRRRRLWGEFAVPVTILLGAAAAAAVLFPEAILSALGITDGYGADTTAFLRRPQTLLWIFLICGQGGLWAALALTAAGSARRVRDGRDPATAVAGTALLVLALVPLFVVTPHLRADYPLPHHALKLPILTVAGLLASLPAFVTIWRVRRLVDEAIARDKPGRGSALRTHDRPARRSALAGFLRLREMLHGSLLILGAIIGAATLATAALRNALLANAHATHAKVAFPIEYVLAYGLFFSALLAVVYVPVYARLQALGNQLVADYGGAGDDSIAALEARQKLRALLNLDVGASEGFAAGLAILAPLASSLLGTLLPS